MIIIIMSSLILTLHPSFTHITYPHHPLHFFPHRCQVQVVSSEYEGLKKALNAHETGRELDDNEKRLKHNERYNIV
jgi:hypothetical protein